MIHMNADKALQILKEHGYKHTKQRETLLNLLSDTDKHISAIDLWKQFKEVFPGASYNTVYRNLYTMVELEIVETTTIEGEQHFFFHCKEHGHHHHFICKNCGDMFPIDLCPMDRVKETMPQFQIENHSFEVYGKCPDCA